MDVRMRHLQSYYRHADAVAGHHALDASRYLLREGHGSGKHFGWQVEEAIRVQLGLSR